LLSRLLTTVTTLTCGYSRRNRTTLDGRVERAGAIVSEGFPTKCRCCGFDFNLVYGPELARDYIEIHHIKSITQTDGVLNPATDLVPLCSNCHSMVHRKRGKIMPVEKIQAIMTRLSDLRPRLIACGVVS
jgi:5-methylcytosine-specific restriction protein A